MTDTATPLPVDPADVVTWPQAATAIVLILAVLVIPAVLTYLTNRRVKALDTTLTTNNGGGSVKDQRDSIAADAAATRELVEARLVPAVDDLAARVDVLEAAKPRGIFGRAR
ncbi:hypothetical protein [Nocardioides yefusunii]|uniref:DUF2746 domain-containing protein n=1 Tax=Nocardioides yefusunii TaxID=2500546 RepID=A0ABW1QXS7_9ACTN|nr:hypothetical protein [Nocardioides yefusunii]